MATVESDKAFSPPLPLSPARNACSTRNESLFSRQQAQPTTWPPVSFAPVGTYRFDRELDSRFNGTQPQALICVNAGRHRMAIVGPDGRRAPRESREDKSDTERNKKDRSHNIF
jgi:hypothetical protein